MDKDFNELGRQINRLVYELQLFSEMLQSVNVDRSTVDVNKPAVKESSTVTEKKVSQTPTQEKPMMTNPKKPKVPTYDNNPNSPTYDPEPPFSPEPVPARTPAIKPSSLIIKKDEIRDCSLCKKQVVKANRDIYAVDDNKEKGLTTEAFDILIDGYWPEAIKVDKVHGGICITCPNCHKLGLWVVNVKDKEKLKNKKQYQTGSI